MTNPSQPSDLRQRLNDLRIQPDHGVKHRRLFNRRRALFSGVNVDKGRRVAHAEGAALPTSG